MKRIVLFVGMFFMVLSSACSAGRGIIPQEQLDVDNLQRSLGSVQVEHSLPEFAYDRQLPLDMEVIQSRVESGITIIDFTYASPRGGRVPARYILPKGKGPHPAIVFMHGSSGDIELMTPEALRFVGLGAAAILIDSPHIRPGGYRPDGTMGSTWPYFTVQDRQDQVQLIVDLQRAIDFLVSSSEIDSDRLAYVGISYGGAMGGLLAGIETRLKAYVLVVGDGGLVEHTSEPGEDGRPDHFSQVWVEQMWPIEPLHFVGRASPAGLLFQNGVHDAAVPARDALRFQAAGSEPRTVLWYEGGHEISGWVDAWNDRALWLQGYLGPDLTWFAPNYRPEIIWVDRACTLWAVLTVLTFSYILMSLARKQVLHVGERVTWILGSLFFGPFILLMFYYGLGAWPHAGRLPDQKSHKQARVRLAALVSSALGVGLAAGTTLDNLLGFQDALQVLAISYLAPVVVLWVMARTWETSLRLRFSISLLLTNLLWAVSIPLGSVLGTRMGMTTDLELRLYWVIVASAWITWPGCLAVVSWMIDVGGIGLTGVIGDRDPAATKGRKARFKPGLWLALSYLLILISLVWLIIHSSGSTVAEFVRFLSSGAP